MCEAQLTLKAKAKDETDGNALIRICRNAEVIVTSIYKSARIAYRREKDQNPFAENFPAITSDNGSLIETAGRYERWMKCTIKNYSGLQPCDVPHVMTGCAFKGISVANVLYNIHEKYKDFPATINDKPLTYDHVVYHHAFIVAAMMSQENSVGWDDRNLAQYVPIKLNGIRQKLDSLTLNKTGSLTLYLEVGRYVNGQITQDFSNI